MAQLRRAALGLLAAGTVASAPAPTGLRLEGGGKPGSLVIVNRSPAPLTIARAIVVERRDGSGWTSMRTEFNAVAACEWANPPARALPPVPARTVSIPPARSLHIARWLGYSCSSQCVTSCAANVYLGPGTFRFRVTMLPGGARATSPAFTLPPERPGDMTRNLVDTVRSQRKY